MSFESGKYSVDTILPIKKLNTTVYITDNPMTYIHISELESIFECENDLDLDLECEEELEKEPENSLASPVYQKGKHAFLSLSLSLSFL